MLFPRRVSGLIVNDLGNTKSNKAETGCWIQSGRGPLAKMGFGRTLIFSREMRPGKNREIFDIL
jgi:hypothetical protein